MQVCRLFSSQVNALMLWLVGETWLVLIMGVVEEWYFAMLLRFLVPSQICIIISSDFLAKIPILLPAFGRHCLIHLCGQWSAHGSGYMGVSMFHRLPSGCSHCPYMWILPHASHASVGSPHNTQSCLLIIGHTYLSNVKH